MKQTFNQELKTALCSAIDLEYSKHSALEDLDYSYQFSDGFEKKMKKVCRKAGCVYVSFGKRRLRLLVAIAFIAAMLCAMTTGVIAGQKLYVKWNETSALMWSDGVSLFQIIGNCNLGILENMVKEENDKV